MFNDREYIKRLVNLRDDDEIVIPLYIQIYGKKYSLFELDDIKLRFTPSAFKIGFCTADSMFMKNSFPVSRIRDFDIVDVFTEYVDEDNIVIRYTVFESGDVEVDDKFTDNEKRVYDQIHSYFDMLYTHVRDQVDEHFKSLIALEHAPIIPKEEPKKESPKFNEGIREYTEELSQYSSSWDPKFVNEETEENEEDPLEALRKEVAEYSQEDGTTDFINGEGKYSDDTETVPGLIVETDKTGTEVEKATEVEFISQGNTDDDYLSEGLYNNYTDDVYDTNEDDDYSTDFDIL